MSAHDASQALTRAYVERVIAEEATAACTQAADVLGPTRSTHAIGARRRAMRRIVEQTKCSQSALARVWGCAASDVSDALAAEPRQREGLSTYDGNTIARLVSCHGAWRAAAIVLGTDPATAADLSAWRKLGRGA